MFTTLTSDNKIVDVGLVTVYREVYDETSQAAPYYAYHRFRTKTYAYIALTEGAAKTGVESKLSQYTRTFYPWRYIGGAWQRDTTHPYESVCATVRPRREDGDLWRLEIDVDEECIVYSNTRLTRAQVEAAMTSAYGTWDYDE